MSELKNKINKIKEKLNLFFEKVGTLTKVQRLLIFFVTFAVIGGAYYYFIFMPKQAQFIEVKENYQNQKAKLLIYKKSAANIQKYENLMAETREKFSIAMKALPDNRELPSLLTDISKAGSNAGLDFHLFQPGKEEIQGFYKIIPVSIKVEGRYHQITDFFFQITKLSRIVNVNNVHVKSKKDDGTLEMSCKAVTYMFVEEKKSKDKNKRKRKK